MESASLPCNGARPPAPSSRSERASSSSRRDGSPSTRPRAYGVWKPGGATRPHPDTDPRSKRRPTAEGDGAILAAARTPRSERHLPVHAPPRRRPTLSRSPHGAARASWDGLNRGEGQAARRRASDDPLTQVDFARSEGLRTVAASTGYDSVGQTTFARALDCLDRAARWWYTASQRPSKRLTPAAQHQGASSHPGESRHETATPRRSRPRGRVFAGSQRQ